MAKVYENLAVSLDSADKMQEQLREDYQRALGEKAVSPGLIERTHTICEKLRGVLDRTAHRYWQFHIEPKLSAQERAKAKVYFPITSNRAEYDSLMGKWQWKALRGNHQGVDDYLLKRQPFEGTDNGWLAILDDLAIATKHIDLVPQKRVETREAILSLSPGGGIALGPGGSINFGPGGVTFSGPVTHSGVTTSLEVWVGFRIEGYNVNAEPFCKQACLKTRQIVTEMTDRFGLS